MYGKDFFACFVCLVKKFFGSLFIADRISCTGECHRDIHFSIVGAKSLGIRMQVEVVRNIFIHRFILRDLELFLSEYKGSCNLVDAASTETAKYILIFTRLIFASHSVFEFVGSCG